MTGFGLMTAVLDACERQGSCPHFPGATDSCAERLASRLRRSHPAIDIAGWRNGCFGAEDEAAIVAAIRASGTDCLFVGISSPIEVDADLAQRLVARGGTTWPEIDLYAG